MVQMGQLIDAAVASQPDGLVVSVPDAEALGDSIRNAVASGIPVVSMNSGSDVREELGVAVHVGQTEYEAGLGGGKKMRGGRHQGDLRQSRRSATSPWTCAARASPRVLAARSRWSR